MTYSLKKVLTAAVLAAVALGGMTAGASAHGKHRKNVVIVFGNGGGHNDCSYYYWKWKNTGLFKWKVAYKECIGVW